uniref:(northern house mosquito) hypothetical protein n=1 Tax=Culex pipiens TaxID=7175 RepID=A0A8D8DM86_CULPI
MLSNLQLFPENARAVPEGHAHRTDPLHQIRTNEPAEGILPPGRLRISERNRTQVRNGNVQPVQRINRGLPQADRNARRNDNPHQHCGILGQTGLHRLHR